VYKKILVPLDGSDLAECVLPHLESIAKGCGAQEVVFLRVVEPFHPVSSADGSAITAEEISRINADHKTAAENYLNRLVERTKYDGVAVQSEIITGKAAEVIADYATKNSVELITIATHGRSGVSRWVLGSVADRVLRSACVPVLMIRAPGCVPGI
jgi:nucleotide-binding universal stress UspA family protein